MSDAGPAEGAGGRLATVRMAHPSRREQEPIAALLARAFRDNPLHVAVISGGPARRLRANRSGLRMLLHSAAPRAGTIRVALASGGAAAGALIAANSGAAGLPAAPAWSQLRAVWGQGWSVVQRWAAVRRRLEALHPREPHCYLAVLGVDPAEQGQGMGAALLDAWLEEVDELGLPAYLESDREEILALYLQRGFAVRSELSIFGVPVRCMWREGS